MTCSTTLLRSSSLTLASFLSLVFSSFVTPLPAPNGPSVTYGGNAVGVDINVPTLATFATFAETIDLPPAGGADSVSVLQAQLPGVLGSGTITASTSGMDGVAESSAEVEGLLLLPGNPVQLSASVVRAESVASCDGAFASSEITDLVFAGLPVVVTGAPNQTITILGVAKLVINEQTTSVVGGVRQASVNALHLKLFTGDEIIISHAESSICLPDATSAAFPGNGINPDVVTPVNAVIGGVWSAPLTLGHPHGAGGLLILYLHTGVGIGSTVVSSLGGRSSEWLLTGPKLCTRSGSHNGTMGDIPPQNVPNDCTLVGYSWSAQYLVFGGGFADLSQAVHGVVGL